MLLIPMLLLAFCLPQSLSEEQSQLTGAVSTLRTFRTKFSQFLAAPSPGEQIRTEADQAMHAFLSNIEEYLLSTQPPVYDTRSAPPDLRSVPPGTGARSAPSDSRSAPSDTRLAPSDSRSAPYDTRSAPSDSILAPSDSRSAPSDTRSAPSDTRSAPSDTRSAPSDTRSAPSDSRSIPPGTGTNSAPSETRSAPPQTARKTSSSNAISGVVIEGTGKVYMDTGHIGEEDGVFTISYNESRASGNFEVAEKFAATGGVEFAGTTNQNYLTFHIGGDRTTFYPVIIELGNQIGGEVSFALSRSSVHSSYYNEQWVGNFNLNVFNIHYSDWGHWRGQMSVEYDWHYGNLVHSLRLLRDLPQPRAVVWLRGGFDEYTFSGINAWIMDANSDTSPGDLTVTADDDSCDVVAQANYLDLTAGMSTGSFLGITEGIAQHNCQDGSLASAFDPDTFSGQVFAPVNGIDLVAMAAIVYSLISNSCNELLVNFPSFAGVDGIYDISYQDEVRSVYCDMTSDGGGWTIVYATDAVDGRMPMVHDEIVDGNPLNFEYYNSGNQFKMDMAAISTQSLFVRGDSGAYLKLDGVWCDSDLNTPDTHKDNGPNTVWASDGTSADAYWGYSNFNIDRGGDFVIGASTIDHFATVYYHLNSGCGGNYLYSYNSGTYNAAAAYKSNNALGDWSSEGCVSSGTGFSMYIGLR